MDRRWNKFSIIDCEECNYTAETLSKLLDKQAVRIHDLKTMTNSFRCPDSNFIRIHQAVFSLLSELAPDVGISSSLMPPYYLSNFDLDYVIDDLKYTKSDAIS